jgi:hypothetical protein
MISRFVRGVVSFAVAFGLASAAASVRADIVKYTESFQATGTLGGQSFTDQAVTLTAFGDTATFFSTPAIAALDAVTATVSIDGLATASFSDVLSVFDVYDPMFGGIFGFTDENSTTGGDILDVQASPFLTYGLTSAIGPVAGTFADFFSLNNPSGTSAGDLVFTSVADSVIVTAAAVPEPSSIVLCTLGFLGILCCARHLRYRGDRTKSTRSAPAASFPDRLRRRLNAPRGPHSAPVT